MSANPGPEFASLAHEIVAPYSDHEITLDAADPGKWLGATAVSFCRDWQGENCDPERMTRVQALWSAETLYLRFVCHFRELSMFDDSDANGRHDHLWERDVAEVFLQPDPSRPRYYKEFEVSPNGMWIDLNIFPGGRSDLNSGMQRSLSLDDKQHIWTAELAIPLKALTTNFDPGSPWGINFFRIEGASESRSYHAWQPTLTPQANFHVPEVFGRLRFAPAPQ